MEFKEKINATILGIIYHPEVRTISQEAKENIGEMVRTLSDSLGIGNCRFVKCDFVDKCNSVCDWAKGQKEGGDEAGRD